MISIVSEARRAAIQVVFEQALVPLPAYVVEQYLLPRRRWCLERLHAVIIVLEEVDSTRVIEHYSKTIVVSKTLWEDGK